MNKYVISVLEMEPSSCLALCDKARQMVKNIEMRAMMGLSTSVLETQPTKALGQHALLKEGCPPPA